SDPPNRLVIKWRNEFRPPLKEEGWSRCVYELMQEGELTRLAIAHTIEKENSQLIEAVSGGWPRVLSSLQSFLETGRAHGDTRTSADRAHA
ncbi:MAG TPA: SRPBCC domain-containing protein, partial [Rhizomicrobium sp.]|nr:SRPBCC domain-containing protein [Rhizomicrobium sp.]